MKKIFVLLKILEIGTLIGCYFLLGEFGKLMGKILNLLPLGDYDAMFGLWCLLIIVCAGALIFIILRIFWQANKNLSKKIYQYLKENGV